MRFLLLAGLIALTAAAGAEDGDTRSYRGYHLVHVVPRDAADVKAVRAISSMTGVDQWSRHIAPDFQSTFMVEPGVWQRRVQPRLQQHGVPHSVSERDVQSLLDEEAREQKQQRDSRLARGASTNVTFSSYMRYDEIEAYLKQLEAQYPNLVKLISLGQSAEGREMTMIRISRVAGSMSRAVIVDAGIHAREWIAPATSLYLINRLVEHSDAHNDLLDSLDWYILPLVNPDGYEFSHTKDRMWRKNRGAERKTWLKWLWNLLCKTSGADLNRNFGFHWRETGASSFPCSETFAGKKAFSEVESQNLRDFILNNNAGKRFKMYLTLHSYGPMILYPYGYTYRPTPAVDTKELISIANEANAAMVAAGSDPFVVQNSADLYPAAGGSDDWVKGVGGVAKSFTIELQGGGRQGFDLPAKEIERAVKHTFEGLKAFALRAKHLD